jgi:hypothetical protein
MMKDLLSKIQQMVEERRILDAERWKLILAVNEAEWDAMWEEGEFDPQRFMARMCHSTSETMLDDLIRVERQRGFDEFEEEVRRLSDRERRDYLRQVEELKPVELPDEVKDMSLTERFMWLRGVHGLELLSVILALRDLPDFAESEELKRTRVEEMKHHLRERLTLFRGESTFQTSVPVRPGDVVNLHIGTARLHIVPSDDDELHIIAKLHALAESPDQARKRAESIEIWTFPEGNRVWVRNSIIDLWHEWVDLQLALPKGVGVRGTATVVHSEGTEGELSLGGREVTVEQHRGKVNIGCPEQSTYVRVEGVEGDVKVESLFGEVKVERVRGDVELRTVGGDIEVQGLSGGCWAQSLEGNLILRDVCTSRLKATTHRGRIVAELTAMPAGNYEIVSKEGDIELILDRYSDCGLSVETREGEINWELPVRVGPWGDSRRLYANVRLGSGIMAVVTRSGRITVRGKEG